MIAAENKLFPVFLKLENFRVLIVGGGKVALEKVNAIFQNSPATRVTLVAVTVSEAIRELSAVHENLDIRQRSFSTEDLFEKDLVIVAVNDPVLSNQIRFVAKEKGILTNVADLPGQCDFYMGSVVRKGDVKIAISTNGKSPTLAKRIRETFEESLPNEINDSAQSLNAIRHQLKGDFAHKVNELNKLTSLMLQKPHVKKKQDQKRILIYSASIISLLIFGYLAGYLLPPAMIGDAASSIVEALDASILLYILAGFTAQMIDGAIGMGYGITSTTFLLSFGISPAASSCSVHASEIFTSGVSGLMHLKFRNVNTKLFRSLLLPGVFGAVLGAYILASFSSFNDVIRPLVSLYTLILGLVILIKALQKEKVKSRIKKLFPLALLGGFLDSIGGGGWGPIVSSTLIARGRNPRYTIGSVNLAEFFIALSSSLTFFALIGTSQWTIIAGLVIGGAIAAPIASWISSKLPSKNIMILVGIVVIILSVKRLFF